MNKELDKYELQTILEAMATKSPSHGMCEEYNYCTYCAEPKSFIRKSNTPCADAYIDMKDINEMLKNYVNNKAKISSIKERLQMWTNALESDDLMFIDVPESIIGMPRAKYPTIKSPIERELEYKEMDKEKIKEMINSEKSRLFLLERQIRKLDIAFSVLPERDMFLIECKYFENLTCFDK